MFINNIFRFVFVAVVISLFSPGASDASPSADEIHMRRKQLYALPWKSIEKYYNHWREVSGASERLDYDKAIFHSEKALAAPGELEREEQAQGRIFRKESNLHLIQYANLAGIYDRKGYCFHAYWYYNKFMEAKNSDFVIVGLFKSYVVDINVDKILYEFDRPAYIQTLDWDFLPFQRCVPESYMDRMFAVDEADLAEYKIIRSFSNKLKVINHEYNQCKAPVVWKRKPGREEYLDRKRACGETAATKARAALAVVKNTTDQNMIDIKNIIESKQTFGEIKMAVMEYMDHPYTTFGPVPRVLHWTREDF